MKILLVDDDPIVILLQKKLMEKAGILDPVVSFNNGEDAISYLVEHASEEEDYLVFLDINMPGLSGWDVLDTLSEIDLRLNLAVIIITSSIERADKEKAGKYEKIIDFWVKPFNITDFVKLKDKEELRGFFS